MFKKIIKYPAGVGFLQALGIVMYTSFIGSFIRCMEQYASEDGPFMPVFVLTLLVFSAAISGSLIFGYPVYLAIQKDFRQALQVLGYTFLFLLLLLILVFILVT